MKYTQFKTAALVLSASALLVLSGCDGTTGTASNSGIGEVPVVMPTPSVDELLVINDGPELKLMSVSGSEMVELSSATMSLPGTYVRSDQTITVTMIDHQLEVGFPISLEFDAGTGGTAIDGAYRVASVVDDNTFTVTDTASGSITDGKVRRTPTMTLTGTYAQVDDTVTVTMDNHGLSSGWTVFLNFTSGDGVNSRKEYSIEDVPDVNTFTVLVEDNATTSGNVDVVIMNNYTHFEATMHPSGKWIYTTSSYQCNWGSPMCWGNAYINRFAIDWNNGVLTYEGSTYAQRGEDALNDGGRNMPTGLTFSEDGSKLFVHDDRLDGIVMWDVNPSDGSISFLAASNRGDAYLHGLSVNSDTTRLYNGSNVFEINTTAPSITLINSGYGCNGSIIKDGYLYCADDDYDAWGMNVWDLNNSDNPSHVDYYAGTDMDYGIVNLAFANDVIVTSGLCGLETFSFDGTTISPLNEYNASDCSGTNKEKFRGVDTNGAGNLVAASYFMLNWDEWLTGASGITLLNVDEAGTLTLRSNYPDYYLSRIVKFIQNPN